LGYISVANIIGLFSTTSTESTQSYRIRWNNAK